MQDVDINLAVRPETRVWVTDAWRACNEAEVRNKGECLWRTMSALSFRIAANFQNSHLSIIAIPPVLVCSKKSATTRDAAVWGWGEFWSSPLVDLRAIIFLFCDGFFDIYCTCWGGGRGYPRDRGCFISISWPRGSIMVRFMPVKMSSMTVTSLDLFPWQARGAWEALVYSRTCS